MLKLNAENLLWPYTELIFSMIFGEKYFSSYNLLIDQISLPDSFYFLKYWSIYVLQLFVCQCIMPWILRLALIFLSGHFSRSPKSQDKNFNISRTKRAFNVK